MAVATIPVVRVVMVRVVVVVVMTIGAGVVWRW